MKQIDYKYAKYAYAKPDHEIYNIIRIQKMQRSQLWTQKYSKRVTFYFRNFFKQHYNRYNHWLETNKVLKPVDWAGSVLLFLSPWKPWPRNSWNWDSWPRNSWDRDSGPRNSWNGDSWPRNSWDWDSGPRNSRNGDSPAPKRFWIWIF